MGPHPKRRRRPWAPPKPEPAAKAPKKKTEHLFKPQKKAPVQPRAQPKRSKRTGSWIDPPDPPAKTLAAQERQWIKDNGWSGKS
jgi:hypothetical protein